MKNKASQESIKGGTPDEWSQGIQYARMMQGLTQSDLADRAGVTITTIYRVERGLPVRRSSLEKICAGLDIKSDQLLRAKPHLQPERESHVLHRASQGHWYAPIDHRRHIPEDDEALVQSPEERLRLGRLGLTPIFVCYPNFVMPEGPGATLVEIYGQYDHPFNPTIYRECMIYCQRGAVRLQIEDDVVELSEGDFVGFTSRDLRWAEPVVPPTKGPPPLVLWFGAVRLGRVVREDGKRAIVRRPRSQGS